MLTTILAAHMFVAQTTTGNSNNTIITVVYILTGISLLVGFAVGTYKYVQRQKKKWTEEGETRAKQAQAMEENTEQMKKNTEAIDNLSGKFGEFATTIRHELNGLGDRIVRLETWRKHSEKTDKNGDPGA
jgi:uncharacterized protein HemX